MRPKRQRGDGFSSKPPVSVRAGWSSPKTLVGDLGDDRTSVAYVNEPKLKLATVKVNKDVPVGFVVVCALNTSFKLCVNMYALIHAH